jgi:F-type H+-transporting ATPase subunit a
MFKCGIINKIVLCVFFALLLATSKLFAEDTEKGVESQHKKFVPGEYIFDHIGDSYEWSVIEIMNKNISIPLPVILYSKQQGLVTFWSSKLNHGHTNYKNFKLLMEGESKGKIVEILPDGSEQKPFDISITKNIASMLFSIFIILWVFISIGNTYKRKGNKAPSGLQSWLEPVILFVRDDIARPSIGEKHYEKFMPFLLTVFFFIWFNNMLGLIPIAPGGANLTGNISVTMVLALFTFIITTINANKNYWKHIVNMPGVPFWLKLPPLPIMPLVELMGVFTKPFVLMVRLFANITAGHIIALGFLSLIFLFGEMNQAVGYGFSIVSVAFIIFMTFLELLVAFIQAYVFTFLSALYFGMAIEEHH